MRRHSQQVRRHSQQGEARRYVSVVRRVWLHWSRLTGSVDEGLYAVSQDLLGESGRPADRDAGTRSASVRSRRATHCEQAVTRPAANTPASMSANGAASGSSNSSARPGTASQTASPVSHRLTSAPDSGGYRRNREALVETLRRLDPARDLDDE